MLATYETIAALTDAFCRDKLNEDYRDLAQKMIAALARKRPSPLASGQPPTWACGVVYLLGQINFLSDKASQPYMTMADVRTAFGVGESTASGKAKLISAALGTNRFDPAFMLPSLIPSNPMVWLAEVNGFMVDLREMPREVQTAAYEKGVIPYIPADRK
jgi:hypothetical protein